MEPLKMLNFDHKILLNLWMWALNLVVIMTFLNFKALSVGVLVNLIGLVVISIFIVGALSMNYLNNKLFNLFAMVFLIPSAFGLMIRILFN